MIYITTTESDNLIKEVNGYFNSHKKRDWFNSELVKKIIKDIDNTVAVKDEYMESPIFGGMSPDRLSGTSIRFLLLIQSISFKLAYFLWLQYKYIHRSSF